MGKGSIPRPFSVSHDEWTNRWDAIFCRDLDTPKEPAQESQDIEHEKNRRLRAMLDNVYLASNPPRVTQPDGSTVKMDVISDPQQIRELFEGDEGDLPKL